MANIRRVNYPFERLRADMQMLHDEGVRILFLYGGEPFLWQDGDRTLHDVVAEARRIGFPLVNVVTNGMYGLDLPEADLILVSIDGTREHHDWLRGHNYDRVIAIIRDAPADNLCLYMAVNSVNLDDIERGYPVLNMRSALPRVAAGSAPRPCPQCVIVEDGEQWTCGRCIEIPGLCEQCGFIFASELSLLFRGSPRVVFEALRAYRAYL